MLKIHSERLVLVAATPDLAKAEREGGQHLAALLGASVPPDWPPPLNDVESLGWTIDLLDSEPDSVGWVLWYFLRPVDGDKPEAIGNGGFKGKPATDGTVEVGYSIMPEQQRNGYATEAVMALLDWAYANPGVRRVIAHTLPELAPSIRVLEKCGFTFVGPGDEEGTILYERRPGRVGQGNRR